MTEWYELEFRVGGSQEWQREGGTFEELTWARKAAAANMREYPGTVYRVIRKTVMTDLSGAGPG